MVKLYGFLQNNLHTEPSFDGSITSTPVSTAAI